MHRRTPTPAAPPGWAGGVKEEARAQWSHDPAGSLAVGDEPLGTPESFARVEAHRYREQPWMHETFDFDRFIGQRVLEVGVGLGTDHLQFARAGALVTGIDLAEKSVDLTRRRFEQEGFDSDLHVMDAEQLSFDDNSYDAVFSFGVLHHTPAPDRAFREIRRVLRPNGVFLGGLYNRRSLFYARVRARRLALLEFRRETLEQRHARIEYSTSDATPLVRLFSVAELKRMLTDAGFRSISIRRRHLGLGELTPHVPARLERAAGSALGWYLIHEAR
jgi:ubiquinone/menaquinone biosynthesis C-methylase UbiE